MRVSSYFALASRVTSVAFVAFGAFGAGCGGAASPAADPNVRAATSASHGDLAKTAKRFSIRGPEASRVSFARLAKFPEPGWQVPRSIALSPDDKIVTYLASEDMSDTMAIFALDRATRKTSVLYRGKDLSDKARPRSKEEDLRRERERTLIEGITSYRWARHAPVMTIPYDEDVFVRDAAGVMTRLTSSPEAEIDPKPCDDGKKVAFVRGRELYVVDVATKRETALTTGAPEGVTRGQSDFNGQEEFDEASGFFWSPRCDAIAYLEVDDRKVDRAPVLGWKNGKADLLEQKYTVPGGVNPSVRVGIVDLATRRTSWVKWGDATATRDQYMMRFRWSDDGGALYLQTISRDQKRRALVRVDPKTATPRELLTETSNEWVDPALFEILDKNGQILTTSDASGHRHLELRNAVTGARAEDAQLTEGDWDVTSIVGVDEAHGRVLFTGTKESVLERHLYAVPIAGGPIEKLTAEPGVHDIVPDEHARAWVDVHSAHDRTPRADVVSDDEKIAELPVPIDDDLASLAVREPDVVMVPGAEGDVLHGALLRPRDLKAGEKHPAIVIVYGGPGVQTVLDAWSPRLFWQHLADRGFFVFQVDGRGSAGRGPRFEKRLYQKLAGVELADQVRAVSWLTSIPEVDPSRIGIYGHSYGGFLAAAAMLKSPGTFAAGAAGSPVTDFLFYDSAYTERYLGDPKTSAAAYEATDLSRFAPALAGPLFLVHANADENVHYANTAKLVEALVKADKRFEMLVLPGEHHGYRAATSRAYVAERVAAFFAASL